jgi:flavorubredoxin
MGKNLYVAPVGDKNNGIYWFCAVDGDLKLFERQYPLTDGMSYNSYIIDDRELVVMDTVDHSVEPLWREALTKFLAERGRKPGYLVVQHLEPDHSAAIESFMRDYPECRLVCSAKAVGMLPQFADGIAPERVMGVKEGDTLEIGEHKLRFAMAPMVHWPEVMVSYEETTQTLFAADAFGTFGSTLAAEVAQGQKQSADLRGAWEDEARRYFINICGKYGPSVQMLLKKAAALPISYLCPLHGPIIRPADYNPIDLYECWSKYEAEKPNECMIAVASLHGNTVVAARRLDAMLSEQGVKVHFFDLSTADLSEAVAMAFACGASVFCCSTYDAGLVPSMRELLSRLKSKGWQKRIAGIVENGSWAPIAGKVIAGEIEELKFMQLMEPIVTVKTRLSAASEQQLRALAENLASELKSK